MNRLRERKRDFVKAIVRRRLPTPTEDPTLHDRTGNLAVCSGCHMRFDEMIGGAPLYVRRFVLYHETGHALLRHRIWLIVFRALSFGLIDPWVRGVLEQQADAFALGHMRPMEFVNAIHEISPPPRNWRDRVVYGKDWKERCVRAGIKFERLAS